ncbi:MAG: hypothetical protein FVQ83_10435 [Chloroflexi bacterium]|nr:hypothetical protein [Chloroflexota bacterium]
MTTSIGEKVSLSGVLIIDVGGQTLWVGVGVTDGVGGVGEGDQRVLVSSPHPPKIIAVIITKTKI